MEKEVLWVGSAKKDLMEMPKNSRIDFGHGLYQAQLGGHPDMAKVLTGFGGANVLELIDDHRGDTFRVVYTVRFADAIVVLHAFQKKSKKGIATPKDDLALIRARLKSAEEVYRAWKQMKDKKNG